MDVSSLDAVAKWSRPLSGSGGLNATNPNRIVENAQAQAVNVKGLIAQAYRFVYDRSFEQKVPPLSPYPSISLHEAVPVLSGALDSDF